MTNLIYDLVVIGGGINGTAIALEATGRGLKTLLCEKGDLACATSSASTKLIHGGLRYLAAYQFDLVKESLKDRKNLCEFAPHLVKPISFYIPFHKKTDTYWKTKVGLYLYNHFAKLPTLTYPHPIAKQSHDGIHKTFHYFLPFQDCYTDDARLVIANAKKARELGADIRTYTELTQAKQQGQSWLLTLNHLFQPNVQENITAKIVINASGPWVENIHKVLFQCESAFTLKLIQGSHLLVNKLYEGEQAYLLPCSDNRVIFIIPYLDKFSLIGTTDLDITNTHNSTFEITPKEINYLIKEVNTYLSTPINFNQIVGHWSGARALPIQINKQTTHPSKISREYKLEFVKKSDHGPYLLSVWGGKLTTHRSLAVKTMNLLAKKINLPFDAGLIYSQYLNSSKNTAIDFSKILNNYPFIPENIKKRWIFSYGEDCLDFLTHCHSLNDLGLDFGQGLYEAEVRYLIVKEWAMSLDDILYRRTKMALFLSPEEKNRLQNWLDTDSRY